MSHYLDHAATTPVLPRAAQALGEALAFYGNPSARYALGRQAAEELEKCRGTVAKALRCLAEEVIFTSGGTEGDNWALQWALQKRKGHIITTAVEHAAVLEPVKALAQKGFEVTCLPVDREGRVDPGAFSTALRPDTVLCSMMLVNNEMGTIQPVGECAALARRYNPEIFFHTDGVQGFLKVPFTPRELGVDALSISGHKIGAPKGIGALYLKKGRRLKPFLLGGGQEGGLRSGTEPTAMIAALAAAAQEGGTHLEEHRTRLAELRGYTLSRLAERLPQAVVLSPPEGAPHILALSLPGYKSEVVVRFLSDRGVYISSGSACHKGKPSHVYAALGLPKPLLDGVLRVSFGPENSREDVDALVEALVCAQRELFTTLS